jgi:hypothetical protein
VDLFDGDVVGGGGGAAVFELGGGVEDLAVEGAELDADGSVGGVDFGVGAVEADALVVADAEAEGAGFGEEEALESGAVGFVGEDGEEGAEAVLFHVDGGGHDVEGALGEGLLGDVGEDLGGEVVEGGFEDGDGLGVFDGGLDVGFAEVEAEDIGEGFGVAGAGAVADLVDAHGGLGAEGGVECFEDGGAGGGDELLLDVGGVGGEATEEVGGGWGGDGEAAVGAVDGASAYVDGGAEPLVYVQVVDSGCRTDDVDDGVYGAYFVEVDFLEGYVVDFGFRIAEELEDG